MKKLTFTLICLLAALTCQARTIIVDANGSGEYPTIQAAIDDCYDGDTVIVAPGTYTGLGNRDIDFGGRAITVRSTDPNDPNIVAATIIDCQGSISDPHRGFYFLSGEDSNSVLDGFTIRGGYAEYGGAIRCESSSPTITNCTITSNSAEQGGGMYNYRSNPTVTNCLFIYNTSDEYGGGMYNARSNPTVTNCLFIYNTSDEYGGGMYNARSNPTVIGCTFERNYAAQGGGGMVNGFGSPTIINCTFKKNSASSGAGGIWNHAYSNVTMNNCIIARNETRGRGAGVYNQKSKVTLTNCRIWGNVTPWEGGGVLNRDCSPTFINCLISSNRAKDGGGICNMSVSESVRPTLKNCTIVYNWAGSKRGSEIRNWDLKLGRPPWPTGKPKLTNCIIWGNSTHAVYGEATVINYSCIQGGWPGIGNISVNPCCLSPASDYHLLENSPCINAGDPDYPFNYNDTDIDGQPRIIAHRIDMGCDEFHGNNAEPIADAGPNQTTYAWIDGIADVNLDGSGSYDDDGHRLTYLWTWTIEPNTYETNGVTPTIELPVGEHIIELIISDGIADSEPNCVTITVIEPIESRLWILPRTINRHSRQKRVWAWLRLPEGITKDDIDSNEPLLLYPGEIEPLCQYIFPRGRRIKRTSIIAYFDKSDLMDVIGDNGSVELKLVGRLKIGRYFYGSDTIRIINRRPPPRRPRRSR